MARPKAQATLSTGKANLSLGLETLEPYLGGSCQEAHGSCKKCPTSLFRQATKHRPQCRQFPRPASSQQLSRFQQRDRVSVKSAVTVLYLHKRGVGRQLCRALRDGCRSADVAVTRQQN